METLDIAALLIDCAESHRIFLEKRGNTLILDIPRGLPGMYGNADHLAQVLANLLSNANTHTDGGEISVHAEDKNDMIEITVRDNGTDVTPELRAHVFERGVSDGGTGLGLSICKAVVESHGGEIDLQSRPGGGTLVTFTLPKRAGGGEKIEFDSASRG
jgi:signal transduction histidine kinase